jgi:hypothetical protein
VILEPDKAGWTPQQVSQAILAAARRLRAHGFTPAFVAPSASNVVNAMEWFDRMAPVPGVLENLVEFSYHRYRGASIRNILAIADRAGKYSLKTSMLEHIGSGYGDLHADLKAGRVSAWQQYTLAYPDTEDSGGSYYHVEGTDPEKVRIYMGKRTWFLRQYFLYIRRSAIRIGAAGNSTKFDPLAFINRDGSYVVVVRAQERGNFTIQGLPPGTYGSRYTTRQETQAPATLHHISPGQGLRLRIPDAGVLTVYDSNSELLSKMGSGH